MPDHRHSSNQPQSLFGELVKLTMPHIKRFHSDLYWDAAFIAANFVPGGTIYFGVAEHGFGTHISTEKGLIDDYCARLWRVKIPKDHTLAVEITEVTA